MGRERQQQKNTETRQAIINAAIQIGLEESFEELSIRKITDKLGYSAGIVYHYFKDKQEILDTIHKKTSMDIMDAVEACISSERSFAENINIVFKMLTEISVHQPETFKLIIQDGYTHNTDTVKTWIAMIQKSLKAGIASGELKNIDMEITAYVLFDAFLVAQMIIGEREEKDPETIKKIFHTEMEIILNGILQNKEDE